MRNLLKLCALSSLSLVAAFSLLCSPMQAQASSNQEAQLKIRVVDFKKCVEKSKIGKQEQANFDGLKKQMEKVLEEKEGSLSEIASKFNDPDYLDSLTPEAENELKHKYRTLTQTYNEVQAQCYQALQQANAKILAKITDAIQKASEEVSKKQNIDILASEEAVFFWNPKLDVSDEVIAILDRDFKDGKEVAPEKK